MSLETPEAHGHHHHKSGRPWLDTVASLSAIFISAVSLYIAVHHGKIMEKLVSANSMPYLDIMSGNARPEGTGYVTSTFVELRNMGVGPAHVKALYITHDGKTVRSTRDILDRCCGPASELDLVLNQSVEHFIPAGQHAPLWSAVPSKANREVWDRFEQARMKLRVEACYCSVFDDCYVVKGHVPGREEVKACVRDDKRHFVP